MYSTVKRRAAGPRPELSLASAKEVLSSGPAARRVVTAAGVDDDDENVEDKETCGRLRLEYRRVPVD